MKSANLKLISFTKHALSFTWLVYEFSFVYGADNMKPPIHSAKKTQFFSVKAG